MCACALTACRNCSPIKAAINTSINTQQSRHEPGVKISICLSVHTSTATSQLPHFIMRTVNVHYACAMCSSRRPAIDATLHRDWLNTIITMQSVEARGLPQYYARYILAFSFRAFKLNISTGSVSLFVIVD